MQAQDYLGALWAVGLRTAACTRADVERALADRQIVRTWPMRGTLHFVAAEDVRWMLELLTPKVIERAAGRRGQLGLDDETVRRAGELFAAALSDAKALTRAEMMGVLEAGGIRTDGQRGYLLLWHHAQRGLLCFGPARGKQQTFVLLDRWVAPAPPVPREEALARIARRYFEGHGPATVEDLARWSGLTLTDARAGLAAVQPELRRTTLEGVEYWSTQGDELAERRA